MTYIQSDFEQFLKDMNFHTEWEDWSEGGATFCFTGKKNIYNFISPHEGTDNLWYLRVGKQKDFDRWANSTDFEIYSIDVYGLLNTPIKKYKKGGIKPKGKIYRFFKKINDKYVDFRVGLNLKREEKNENRKITTK